MKFFTQLASGIDVQPLLAQLEENPDLWDSISTRRTAQGSPHSRMTDIWVRYRDDAPHKASGDYSRFLDEHIPVWYPAWKRLPALRPLVFDLMAAVQGEMLGGILITRIPPGEGIAPHVDKGWHVDYYDKFYISLSSAPGSDFICQDERLNPHVGDCFRFDNRLEHSVENTSDVDRITLIVCIRTDVFKEPP